MEGYPYTIQTDLRYYLDTRGKFTTRLREHYDPWRRRSSRCAYVKFGDSWMVLDFSLLTAGMIFRVEDTDGEFINWRDDGSILLYAMEDARPNLEGVWFTRVRKPTAQELADA